jgi:CRP/FNR family transcriptional regulator, cyclic AMP receptor protein
VQVGQGYDSNSFYKGLLRSHIDSQLALWVLAINKKLCNICSSIISDENWGGKKSLVEAVENSLGGVDLFAALNKDELAKVESRCRWRRFAPHQQIIDRESSSRDVFFVISGKVRIVNYSFSGRGIILDELEAGSYFGELSAIDSQPRSARVISIADSLIGSLPQKYFLETLESHPKMALMVMEHLSKMLRGATQRIMDLSTLGANNRVHADLLRQAGEITDETKTAILDPVPIHNDIASRVSTTRETVARVMNDLARRNIVEKKGNALIIKDVQRLRDMVEEVRGE